MGVEAEKEHVDRRYRNHVSTAEIVAVTRELPDLCFISQEQNSIQFSFHSMHSVHQSWTTLRPRRRGRAGVDKKLQDRPRPSTVLEAMHRLTLLDVTFREFHCPRTRLGQQEVDPEEVHKHKKRLV